jgi:poly(A) polymerase
MVLKRIKELLTRAPRRRETVDEPAAAQASSPIPPATSAPPAVRTVHRGPDVVHHPVALQDLDPDAVRIIKRLTRFDHAAYLVGGCVRDLLLLRQPKDFDIGTSATPRQIKRLFSNCRIIGRRFRLAHIFFQNGKIIEVATFRAHDVADGGAVPESASTPEDAEDLLIRDDNVFGTPEEDARRRDFTVNALFYDVNAETVIDHTDGMADLRRRVIRTIGDPVVRFREDPIRILRAIKFAARLDFELEATTRAALIQTSVEIPKAAPPRVLEEINRFCRGGAARRSFDLCLETGVFEAILPELIPTYRKDEAERRVLHALMGAIDARLAAGREISTGEIFSVLLFAPVARSLGMPVDGGGPPARDHRDARTIVDDAMRPIALRLRVARKDQERTRQVLSTLQRMVPMRAMRRAQRLTLMKRPAFTDALWMLEALAPVLEGEFAAAREAWAQQVATHGAVEPERVVPFPLPPEDEAGGRAATEGERKRRRRRGRRGGAGRKRGAEPPPERPAAEAAPVPGTPAPPRPREPRARDPKLPPVWDDDYFFAALPSVPRIDAETDDTDRYGANLVAAPQARGDSDPASTVTESQSDGSQPAPRRRRRRGGRRHRKAGPIIPPNGSPAPAGGEA